LKDRYVFDDGSNEETIKKLKELKNKYNFNLTLSKKFSSRERIWKDFSCKGQSA